MHFVLQMYGDMMFMMRQPTLARLYAEQGRTVYTYRFDFEGQLNFLKNGLKARMKGLRPVEGKSSPSGSHSLKSLAWWVAIGNGPVNYFGDDIMLPVNQRGKVSVSYFLYSLLFSANLTLYTILALQAPPTETNWRT